MWIDSHCHLEAEDYCAADANDGDERAAVIDRARAAGVTRLIAIGSGRGRQEIENAVAFARSYSQITAAIGVHPHHAGEVAEPGAEVFKLIEKLAVDPRVVALGETGLDYHYKYSTPAQQQALLRRFLQLSVRVGKPVSLHIRSATAGDPGGAQDAHVDAQRIVREECGAAPPAGGVIHCFTGTPDEARAWLDLGFAISLSGVVTFKNAEPLRQAARLVPADRLLLETDSPYLAPVPHRGKRNEPALLIHTARHVAELRGISPERLAEETRSATERLFRLPALLV